MSTDNEVMPPHCELCERALWTSHELNRRIDLAVVLCDHCLAEDCEQENDCWCGYGFFPGGDPRQFEPDAEMSSGEEIDRWRAACAAWESGTRAEPAAEEHGPWTDPETGTVTIGLKPSPSARGACHAVRSFGMGSYSCEQHRLPDDAWRRGGTP